MLLDIPSFLFLMGVYFQTALHNNVRRNGQIHRLAGLVNDLDTGHRRSQQINKQIAWFLESTNNCVLGNISIYHVYSVSKSK